MGQATNNRVLGVTVLADFILSEGIDEIIENLQRIGATAVACNPTVTAPAAAGTGTFQPPADAGSSPRLFDRKLFGKHSLWVQSAPSYFPQPDFYAESSYGPRKVKDLTHEHGDIIGRFIEATNAAGMKVYFQLGSAQPSGLRDEDRPRQPDGTVAAVRMADTGSLASPAIRAYNRAYVKDLLAIYPSVCGFRIDWPEYPCYTMGEVFHDFSPHVQNWARVNDFDFESIQNGIGKLYEHLQGGLTDDALAATGEAGIQQALASLAGKDNDSVAEWLKLKAALSVDMVADWRRILDDAGRPDLELTAHAFLPPYATITGLDFEHVVDHCDAVSPKFYTMHWPLMVKFWSDWLIDRNPNLDRPRVVRALASWMELGTSDEIDDRLDRYRYPEPNEEHPIPVASQQLKLQQVRDQLGDSSTPLVPLVHGYGPPEDFARRFRVIAEADVQGVWINRYGYLGNDKLDAIKEVWKACGRIEL